jgi:hypothetical protein
LFFWDKVGSVAQAGFELEILNAEIIDMYHYGSLSTAFWVFLFLWYSGPHTC